MKILNETKATAIKNYNELLDEIKDQYKKIEKYEEIIKNTSWREQAWWEAKEKRDELIISDDRLLTYYIFHELNNHEFWYTLDHDNYDFRKCTETYKVNKNFENILNRICKIVTDYVLYNDEEDYYEE